MYETYVGSNVGRRKPLLDQSRAVALVRVSTKDQDIGAGSQRNVIARWCEQNDLALIATFEDRLSGATALDKRPGIQGALDACISDDAGILLGLEWDRVARSKHLFSDLERECESRGIRLLTVEGGLNESAVLRDIKQALASEERRKISERNKRRVAECRRRGQLHGGPPPFGFRRKPGGRKGQRGTVVELAPHPKEHPVLATILDWRDGGLSLRAIATNLNLASSHSSLRTSVQAKAATAFFTACLYSALPPYAFHDVAHSFNNF